MSDCKHFIDGACVVVGGLCDAVVEVDEETCQICSKSDRPGPRQRNVVTASAAVRWMRENAPDKIESKMGVLREYLSGCNKSKGPKNLLLTCGLCPGDIMTMTAAVRSMHEAYPGTWTIGVKTTCQEIWDNNPDVVPLDTCDKPFPISMSYTDQCNRSNQSGYPFITAYLRFLESVLGVSIPLAVNRPLLYLSDEERGWISQVAEIAGKTVPYWIVNAGVKDDYTAKQWPIEYYQEVVDRTRHQVEWVQVGESGHDHPALSGVLDLRGKTSSREFIRLVYHSQGGIGPVTFLQHVCAAWEKPYVCLLGGREPVTWVSYPKQHTLHTIGSLDCCREKACWRSKIVGDGDSLCELPVLSGVRPVGRCMQIIKPSEVISILERFL